MNDLKNGILDINGFLVGPNTTLEELEAYFGVKAKSLAENYKHFDFDGQSFVNHGLEFKANISLNEKIVKIEMFPQFPEIDARYGANNKWRSTGDRDKDLAYYRELRLILDEWLEKQLGAPTFKDEECTDYRYNNLLIGTCAYIDERDRDLSVKGGRVVFWYGI